MPVAPPRCFPNDNFVVFDPVDNKYYYKGDPNFEMVKKRTDEIWAYESNMPIEKTKFEAFAKEIADILGYTLDSEAMRALREASQLHLTDLFREASAYKDGRVTLMPSDLQQTNWWGQRRI